jgi:ABC-type branched-subunit amino acid transport system substrate-binding protein
MLAGGVALLATPAWANRAEAMSQPESLPAPLPQLLSPLRVGVLADLTGPLSGMGKQIQSGIAAMAGTLGGAQGRCGATTIELVMADRATGERDAIAGLLRQGVHALVGGGDRLAEAGNTFCTPTLLLDGTANGPYVFQAGPSAAQVAQAQIAAVKAAGLDCAGRVSVIAVDPQSFAAQGIQLAGTQLIPPDATCLAPQAAAVVAGGPAAVIVNALPSLEALAVKNLRAAGFTGLVFASPSATDPGFAVAAGEQAAEGIRAVSPWLPALAEVPESLPHLTMMQRFAANYQPAHGRAGAHAGYAADAVSLLHLAFLGHRDRGQAQARLEQMSCVGVTGVYNTSRSRHDGLDPAALTTLRWSVGAWRAGS